MHGSTLERILSLAVLVLGCTVPALAIAACGSRAEFNDSIESSAIAEGALARRLDDSSDAKLSQMGYLGTGTASTAFLGRVETNAGLADLPADAAAPAPQNPAAPPSAEKPARLRIYKARAEVLVPTIAEAITKFTTTVENEGGYVETRNDADIVCRVPVASFKKLIEELKTYGIVTRFSESAEDVTRQHLDLVIRLENADKSRQRLLAILEKATDTEAILKIEQEIRRLTDEIEQMQASLRNLDQQIAYSTIEAIFHANAPEIHEPVTRSGLFPWFDTLGLEQLSSSMERSSPASPSFLSALFGDAREPPKGFIAVATTDADIDYKAIAADRSKFRARIFESSPEGDLAFWLAAFRSDFKDRRGYVILSEKSVSIDGRPGAEFVIEGTVRGQPLKYLFAMSVEEGRFEDRIHVTEYLAEKPLFDAHASEVRATANIETAAAH